LDFFDPTALRSGSHNSYYGRFGLKVRVFRLSPTSPSK
jgi:hypothetical protein